MGLSFSVFPAYAGMSPEPRNFPVFECGFPRLRGDEPGLHGFISEVMEFSPPTRG